MNEVTYLDDSFVVSVAQGEAVAPHRLPASGYGLKIPTPYTIKCADSFTRRVYAACISNVASHYIIVKGEKKVIRNQLDTFFYPA